MADKIYTIEFKEDGSAKVKTGVIGIGTAAHNSAAAIDKLISKIKQLNSMSGTSKGAGQVTPPTINMGSSKQLLAEMTSGMNAIQDLLKININSVDDLNSSMASLSSTTTTINNVTNNTTNAINRYSTAVIKAQGAMQKTAMFIRSQLSKEFQYLSNVVSGTMRKFNIMGQVLGGLATYFSAREFFELSDEWIRLNTSIKLVSKSEDELFRTRKKMLDNSRENRSDIDGTAKLYQRLMMAQKTLGASSSQVLDLTNVVQKSLTLNAASAQEARSALIQLSQGMSDTTFKAEEFNAVLTAVPSLMMRLADSYSISTKELKDQLSSGVIPVSSAFERMVSFLPEVTEQMKKVGMTFGQVKQVFKNTFLEVIGGINEATGLLPKLTGGLLKVADSIRDKIPEITAFFKTLSDLIEKINKEKGAGGVFIEVGRLAGEIFVETVALGFKSFTTIVVGLGKILVDTIIDRISEEQPKLAKALKIDPVSRIEKLSEDQKKSLVSRSSTSDIMATQSSRMFFAGSEDDIAEHYIKNGRLSADAYTSILKELAENGKIAASDINAAFAGISFEDVAQQLKKLSDESMTNAMSKADALHLKFTDKTFSEAYKENLTAMKDPMKDIISMIDEMIAKYDDMVSKVKDTPKEVIGFWKGFGESFDGLINTAEKFGEVVGDQLSSAIAKTSDTLASFIMDGKADFKALAKSIIQDILSIIIQQQILFAVQMSLQAMKMMFGIGTVPTPEIAGNQFGGQVQSGQPTIVGERRPEIFVPQSAGRIEAYPDSMGGKSQEIRIINAVDGDAVLRSASMATVEKMVMNVIANNSRTVRGAIA